MGRINRSRNEVMTRRELVRRTQDMYRQNEEDLKAQSGSETEKKGEAAKSDAESEPHQKQSSYKKSLEEAIGVMRSAGASEEQIAQFVEKRKKEAGNENDRGQATEEKGKSAQNSDQDLQVSGGGGGKSTIIKEKEHDYGPETKNTTERSDIKKNVEIEEVNYASSLFDSKYTLSVSDDNTLKRINTDRRERAAVMVRGYDLGASAVTEKKTIMDRVPIFDENDNLSYLSYFYTYSPPINAKAKPKFTPYFISVLSTSGNTKPAGDIPLYTKNSSENKPDLLKVEPPNIPVAELSRDYPSYQKRLIGFFLEKKSEGGYSGYVNVGSVNNPLYYFISFTYSNNEYEMNSAGFVFIGKTFNTNIPTLSDTQRQMSMGEFINGDTKKNPGGDKTLGKITGLNTIASREERLKVNHYINYYFNNGESDATINQIIPIGVNKSVYYRLDFTSHKAGKVNNVDVAVTRIGDEIDVKNVNSEFERMYDIQDIKGYESHIKSKDDLIEWLTKYRYKNISPGDINGNTIEDVRRNMKNKIRSKAGDPASKWFELNYGIKVFYTKADAEAGYSAFVKDQSQKSKDIPSIQEQAAVKSRIKGFTQKDQLLKLEAAMHRLGDETLTLIKNTTFFRQSKHVEEVQNNGTVVEDETTNGFTRTYGGTSIVAIYDTPFATDQFVFFGSTKTKITSRSSGTMLHEIAHALAEYEDPKAAVKGTKYRASFYDYVDKNSIEPITDYSRSDNTKNAATPGERNEFWADAFLIYHTDPDWLNKYHTKIFTWFTTRF